MALRLLSVLVANCQQGARRMKTRILKTLLALALVIGSALSTAACDDTSNNNNQHDLSMPHDSGGGGG
jgi:hypothetical protein